MNRDALYKKDLSSLYKLAQKYHNLFIRTRDQKVRGHCITCKGGIDEAGHFEHGGNDKYSFWCDFSKKNLNGQCTHCNHFLSGNLNIYAEKLIEMYGVDVIAEMNALRWKSDAWGKEDLIDIIEDRKKRIKELNSLT